MAAYGLAYVVFFLFDKEWSMVMKKFKRWIFQYLKKQKVKEPVLNKDGQVDKRPGAYLTIFMYFVQVGALLQIEMIYNKRTEREEDFEDTTKSFSNVFSFEALGLTGWNTCIMKGIDPVKKLLIKAAFIFYLFGTLLVLYLISVLIRCPWAKGRWNQQGCGLTPLSLHARFLNAFVILILYTYEFLSENGITLLKCVSIKSTGDDVLWIDGSVVCMQDWQYAVIMFVCIYVVPMFLVIGLAPILLKEDKINLVVFVISIVFPLFALPYLLYLFIRLHQKRKWEKKFQGLNPQHGLWYGRRDQGRRKPGKSKADFKELQKFAKKRKKDGFDRSHPSNTMGWNSHAQMWNTPYPRWDPHFGYNMPFGRPPKLNDPHGAKNLVLRLVAEPYDFDKVGFVCWEGVIILRRLILVVLVTTIPSFLLKHILLTIACLIILGVHLRIQPFKKRSSNMLEATSLYLLLCIAFMNMVKSVYFESGEIPDEMADNIFRVYDVIENVLVGILPIAILALLLICILVRLVIFPFELCLKGGRKRRDEMKRWGLHDGYPGHMPMPMPLPYGPRHMAMNLPPMQRHNGWPNRQMARPWGSPADGPFMLQPDKRHGVRQRPVQRSGLIRHPRYEPIGYQPPNYGQHYTTPRPSGWNWSQQSPLGQRHVPNQRYSMPV